MKRSRTNCRRIRRCNAVLERLVVDAPAAMWSSSRELDSVDRNLQVELLELATAVEMLEKCGAYA
jgi:hypothetical protein